MPRKLRAGDRVVLRSDLSPEREQQATLRGLPLNIGGFVSEVTGGEVAVVRFANGRNAFVREEDLRVLTTVEERLERKEQSRREREARRTVEQAGTYVTPETVEQAYAFGKMGAIHGRPHMERSDFLATSTDHPHPNSLWRAYRRGWREGRLIRKFRAEARENGREEN